jgi:hypothetical protein
MDIAGVKTLPGGGHGAIDDVAVHGELRKAVRGSGFWSADLSSSSRSAAIAVS